MVLVVTDLERSARVAREVDDERWTPARARLGRDAERAAAEGPWTVVRKELLPPSGDRRDYCTLSEYFWPDPERPDGLPWVLRDGHINPAASTRTRDADQLRHMAQGARTLALAGRLLDRPDLSAGAARVLRTWFLDPATAMRPHLRYASLVPGLDAPPGWGLIRAHPLVYALDATELAAEDGVLGADERDGITGWAEAFLDWTTASAMWPEERARGNNHTTWCTVLVLALATWCGADGLARELAATVPDVVADQVEADGAQPRELARPRSYFYCSFNLDGLCTLADLARRHGVDAWAPDSDSGRRLRAAVRWMVPAWTDPDTWPVPFRIEWDRTHGASPLHRAAARCPDAEDLRSAIARVPVARDPRAREWLLWESGVRPEPLP